MADENETIESAEATTPVTAPEPKKQRAPRQKKAAAEVTAPAPAATVKSPRGARRKLADKPAEAPTSDTKQAFAESKPDKVRKGVGRPKGTQQAAKPVEAPVHEAALDEMADLIQLEEENKRLRKALSEKLRTENADLRKRLGHA